MSWDSTEGNRKAFRGDHREKWLLLTGEDPDQSPRRSERRIGRVGERQDWQRDQTGRAPEELSDTW